MILVANFKTFKIGKWGHSAKEKCVDGGIRGLGV